MGNSCVGQGGTERNYAKLEKKGTGDGVTLRDEIRHKSSTRQATENAAFRIHEHWLTAAETSTYERLRA